MTEHTRIYLIRHGQVNGFENFTIYGHTDIDLTEIGYLQMEKLAQQLRFVDVCAVYCSDLKRSVAGAKIICRYHDAPLYPLKDLREMYFGEWEGMTLQQIRERFPDELEKRGRDLLHYAPPGGAESVEHLSRRVMSCFNKILKKHIKAQVIIVAHGAVNRVILCHALGLELTNMFNIHQDYGCLNIIDYFSDHALVRLING
ncbi:MAG: histidine phosphatase family protein [Deltaproteobacteria bacterium]|nr:histidine phosphatase family protein [Deltaproteobacteria bacterium]MBW1927919.1 histidine phosphatase family protein [Deltaproteobacteria bacterium]MBW2024840.1 histidine phosphatase family protein [Deltaproteobacteria bacterium]MBW2124782.1 histidine phosphatase family protein [Deltaproteobacteria bacterium]RLB19877.1 MAG: alpha-ribazole phosphatase [Deltaproteobacteria bacterium]